MFTERTTPRTDCPEKLPPAPPIAVDQAHFEGKQPMNDLQRTFVRIINDILGVSGGENFTEYESGEYIRKMMAKFLGN